MTDAFHKLSFDNVYDLLKLVDSNQLYSNAMSTYSVYHTDKDLTEKFITELKLIHNYENGKKLEGEITNKDGGIINKNEMKMLLIEILMRNNNEYSKSVADYIELFKNNDGRYVYTPNKEERLKYSGIRNFLYELGVVDLQKNNRIYQLNIEQTLISSENITPSKLNPKILCILLQIKKEIGEKAELCVLEYEKRRLENNKKLLNMLEHVALIDVSAGYDILSWEITTNSSENIPRYIEVKAISINRDNRFYWSSNEIDIARKYGERYSLYLVPRTKDEFLIDDVRIISNPSMKIFDGAEWNYKIENYSIWPNN